MTYLLTRLDSHGDGPTSSAIYVVIALLLLAADPKPGLVINVRQRRPHPLEFGWGTAGPGAPRAADRRKLLLGKLHDAELGIRGLLRGRRGYTNW